ncbi:MAG TPA: S9 family peptidase [Candidatus Sulfotelmatobacter sp.]|nr:S9 family peptidase [Candidatus Sulfotelmatobacter sp.]
MFCLILLGWLFCQEGNAMNNKLIPLRDFFRNPEKALYQISPDGQNISWLASYENRLNIFVQPRAGGEAKRLTAVTDRDLADYFWKGDDHLIYLRDFGGDENFHFFSVSRDGRETRDLTPFPGVRADLIDDLYDDPDWIIVGLNKRNREIFDAFRLNVKTGELKLLAENPGTIAGWLTDHDGRLRAAMTSDGLENSILFRDSEAAPFQKVLTCSYKDTFAPLFFTFDNKQLYVVSNLGRDKRVIERWDPVAKKEAEMVYANPEVDVDTMSYSRKRKVLTSISWTTWKKERKFLDQTIAAIFNDVESKLPGYELDLEDVDRNEDTFIVRSYSDRTRGAYYLYELAGKKLTKLADISPWLKEDELAEMKPIKYKSRDGLTINGYLIVPEGQKAKDLPVVVNPHGGPWVRDRWGFNPEAQFLANRGYAVFKMNYRGSTGYGKKFYEASFKQWGKKMQDDVTDGVKWLIAQGIADPKKVAIFGGSYGGYATLAGITFTPDLYCCAVDYVGVSNLFTFMKTIPPYWKLELKSMYEMVGDPEKDKELLRSASPVFHADKIKVPLLIAQGAQDPRVNKAESDQMVAALKKRGVEVEYLVKDNEGHGFHNEENRFAFYEAMERFFAKHLAK